MDPALFQENERTAPQDKAQILPVGDFTTESGQVIPNAQGAYQTWGELDETASNAVLVCHALSGDANAAGWWERMIGPGRPIDPKEHFIIGTNCLGGCQGSTGPGTTVNGRRLGSRFPRITLGDMVDLQALILEHLGISRLKMVCGGSMGGMQALEWSLRYPHRVEKCWMTASAARHSPMQIGFNESSRQAILRDPKWQNGDYQPGDGPHHGLAVARMIGHLSYLSWDAFDAKFGRRMQDGQDRFQVESYLNYQGDKFNHRFDAGSLVALTRAIDDFDRQNLDTAECEYLFTSFTSDWIYPSRQSQELLEMAQNAGKQAEWREIDLPYGHDAFLLDGEIQGEIVREFLNRKS